jgi:uncharacterized protein (UPF0276 family)
MTLPGGQREAVSLPVRAAHPGFPPLPAATGIGLRAAHHDAFLEARPAVGWVEVHSENFFADGGPQLALLERVRRDYPLSCHGVGLSLGSTDPLDRDHLRQLRRLVQRFDPALVSEHCSWSSVGGRFANDLLPLPCTEEALDHMTARVMQVQDELGRRILVENPSTYVEYACSTVPEAQFLAELAARTGCGLLLDVNNVYVSSRNHGFDAAAYLRAIPPALVAEVHLAGFSIQPAGEGELLVDTHSTTVWPDVWSLYALAVALWGPRPTLIEWDLDLPPLATLVAEAARADAITEGADALVA